MVSYPMHEKVRDALSRLLEFRLRPELVEARSPHELIGIRFRITIDRLQAVPTAGD